MTLESISKDIELGVREYNNKTRKYLLAPVILYYGELFVERLKHMYVYAVGINDYDNPHDYSLFLLVDVAKSNDFARVLPLLQSNSYVSDYPFGELLGGRLHMIVINVPSEFRQAYDMFMQSKYSKMFSKEQVYEYIIKHIGNTQATATMLQTEERRIAFEDELNHYRKYYNTEDAIERKVNDTTWITLLEDSELDYMIREVEEIFNYK